MFKNLFKNKEEKELTSKPQVVDCIMQPVISHDNILVQVQASICYNVVDYKAYKNSSANPKTAIEYLTITTMRNIMGEVTADFISTNRNELARDTLEAVKEASKTWGIDATHIDITRIVVPDNLNSK